MRSTKLIANSRGAGSSAVVPLCYPDPGCFDTCPFPLLAPAQTAAILFLNPHQAVG